MERDNKGRFDEEKSRAELEKQVKKYIAPDKKRCCLIPVCPQLDRRKVSQLVYETKLKVCVEGHKDCVYYQNAL